MPNIHETQKESLIKECKSVNLVLKEVIELGDNADSKKSALSSTLKSITGGKLKPDYHQIFIFENSYIYIQPYSGVTVLPGEHHKIKEGTFAEPLVLADTAIFASNSWKCPNNKELSKTIQKDFPGLKNIAKKTSFEWTIGIGKIELEWAFQLYSFTESKSHFIMKSGRYGGLTTYMVGFKHFKTALTEIAKLLKSQESKPSSPIYDSAYTQLALTTILGESYKEELNKSAPEDDSDETITDYVSAITKLSTTNPSIFTDNISEKKLKNIYKKIIPEKYKDSKIIAFYDTSIFGSGKDGIAFCSETCHINDAGEKTSFDYKDIEGVGSVTGKNENFIEIQLKMRKVRVTLIDEYEPQVKLFKKILQINKLQ